MRSEDIDFCRNCKLHSDDCECDKASTDSRDKCPTCGSPVQVSVSGEGTGCFIPVGNSYE